MTTTALRDGLSLAYWLARIHPDLFAAVARAARQGQLGALGDDGIAPALIAADDPALQDVGISAATGIEDVSNSAIAPDLLTMPDPLLQDIGVEAATSGAGVSTPISTASSITAPPVSAGALSSVGGFLASATGLGALTNLATAYYRSNTPQLQTIQTQVARVQAGSSVAPITYGYNSAGQIVPVLAQAGMTTPLTAQTLSNLLPSSWQQYALPVGLGLLAIWALTRSR